MPPLGKDAKISHQGVGKNEFSVIHLPCWQKYIHPLWTLKL